MTSSWPLGTASDDGNQRIYRAALGCEPSRPILPGSRGSSGPRHDGAAWLLRIGGGRARFRPPCVFFGDDVYPTRPPSLASEEFLLSGEILSEGTTWLPRQPEFPVFLR